jgi:predicted MFS family arabinose efflux permease
LRSNFRSYIMSLMIFIVMINYVDRGALSYAQEPIIKLYHLNPKTWGEVLGYFGYGYIIGSLFGGAIADRKGPKFVGTCRDILVYI